MPTGPKRVSQKLFLLSLLALACIVALIALSVRELMAWNDVANKLGRQAQEAMLDGIFYSATVRATAEAVSYSATGNAGYAKEARDALLYADSALAQLRRLAGGGPAFRLLEGDIGALRRQQESVLGEVRARVGETLRQPASPASFTAERLAVLYGPEPEADSTWTETLAWHERTRQQSLALLRIHEYRLLWLVSATLVVCVVWVVALLAFVNRGIAVPVDRLARAAEHVAQGDLERQVEVSSDDEIGGLQRAFNRMVQDLRLQQSALAQQGQQLAQLVAAASKARGAVEHADRAKTKFLANLSHEIRTPISGVLGMTDLLLLSTLDERQRHYARSARNCGEALLRLIDDMLELTKIQTTALPHEASPFDLPALLQEACLPAAERARGKGLALRCEIADAVPRIVVGEAQRLLQVLQHLLDNAVKFTESGGVLLRAEALDAADGESGRARLRFSVEDSGIGILPESLGRIFDSFAQADESSARRYRGVGLGLALCKHLVAFMGGELMVDSQAGHGSRFWFELSLPLETAAPPPAPEPPAPVELADRQILLVDDNLVNRELTRVMLERSGARVVPAESGAEALSALEMGRFDLILMDCQLPGMDGFETTRRIRAGGGANADIPIVALTADVMGASRERCLEAGMNERLAKPCSAEQLEATLGACLAAARPVPALVAS